MLRSSILAAALLLSPPGFVRAQVASPLGATPMTGHATLDAFHGEAGVRRVVADLRARLVRDRRIADIFRATDMQHLQTELSDQICALLNGPSHYTGRSMAEAHANVGLQDADFNALVEDLQAAMDDEGVAFRAQNRLLAKLAPMRRVVVRR